MSIGIRGFPPNIVLEFLFLLKMIRSNNNNSLNKKEYETITGNSINSCL